MSPLNSIRFSFPLSAQNNTTYKNSIQEWIERGFLLHYSEEKKS